MKTSLLCLFIALTSFFAGYSLASKPEPVVKVEEKVIPTGLSKEEQERLHAAELAEVGNR